jgi:nonsense-mediated mRNA decay protein 3
LLALTATCTSTYLLARLRVSFSGAEFVFSKPHSKRLHLKLRLRREVLNGIVLEQTYPVEFVVHNRLCNSCARAQANPDQWVAVVQLRQHLTTPPLRDRRRNADQL